MKRWLALTLTALLLTACTPPAAAPSPTARPAAPPAAAPSTGAPAAAAPKASTAPLSATLVLDWFPNTNHVGIYLAQAKGWYAEQGLDLRVETPSDASASMKLVGNSSAELGISYEPAVIIARSQDVPVVSVAALVQHNIGAYAAKTQTGITRPKQFEGKRFGTSGLVQAKMQFEAAIRCDNGDPSKVEEVALGQQISQAMLADRVDFMGMLPTWEGIELEMKGTALNYMYYRDWCLPDAYHLVFISSENTIRDKPDVIRRFAAATQRGYEYAVKNPDEAATTLLAAAPDLNPPLVQKSLERLNPFFIAESPRWGLQEAERWTKYAGWLNDNKLIQKPIDPLKAFSTEFVPGK